MSKLNDQAQVMKAAILKLTNEKVHCQSLVYSRTCSVTPVHCHHRGLSLLTTVTLVLVLVLVPLIYCPALFATTQSQQATEVSLGEARADLKAVKDAVSVCTGGIVWCGSGRVNRVRCVLCVVVREAVCGLCDVCVCGVCVCVCVCVCCVCM